MSAPTKKGKGTKIMIMVDALGTPLAVHSCSASPAEVKLVHDTLEASFGVDFPQRLIGDKAYDSDGLHAELSELGIQVIAPNRKNRNHKTQDGRPLRRVEPSLACRAHHCLAAVVSPSPNPL